MTTSLKLLAVAGTLSTMALFASMAEAHDYGLRNDFQRVQNDRATVAADEARLARERAELAEAKSRAKSAWWHGDFWTAVGSKHRIRREAKDVRAAEAQLDADRARLQADATHAHREAEARRHWWW